MLVPEALGFAGTHMSHGEMYMCVEPGLVRKTLRETVTYLVAGAAEEAFLLVLLLCLALERREYRLQTASPRWAVPVCNRPEVGYMYVYISSGMK